MSILILAMLTRPLQVILLSPSFHGWENQDTEDTMNITIPGSGILASSLSFPQNQEVWLAHLIPPDVCWGAPLSCTECWKMESGICAREASCWARLYWAGTRSLHKLPTQRWAVKLLELLLRGVRAHLRACMHARMCMCVCVCGVVEYIEHAFHLFMQEHATMHL